jgi:hypothetical protein
VGSLFAPFHFAEGAANLLTNDALDFLFVLFPFCAFSF